MMKYISLLILLLSLSLPLFSTEKVNILGVEMEWDGYKVKESETDLDPYSTSFDDIGEGRFFQSEYPVDKERYIINQGNMGETEVIHIHSDNPGPIIYIVAGVHGDERAAWYAGIIMENATIRSGDISFLLPINREPRDETDTSILPRISIGVFLAPWMEPRLRKWPTPYFRI